jgi:hypothetical protein
MVFYPWHDYFYSTEERLETGFEFQKPSVIGEGSKTGILSLTHWFKAGQYLDFQLRATSSTYYASVPIPDMLWPTLVGMVGISLYAERVRRRRLIA